MRRSYIAPEFTYTPVNGTFNMAEKKSFFGSKMVDIEDLITLDNNIISYYQSSTREQLNLNDEKTLPIKLYNITEDKKTNSTLVIDPKQAPSDKEKNTRYILTIDLKTLLINYIFACLKNARTFEGITHDLTKNNDVDVAIKDYITSNLLNRYRFKNISLYIKYNDLKNAGTLRYDNAYDSTVYLPENELKKFNTDFTANKDILNVTFNQQQSSGEFNFSYYFTIIYEKI